MAALMVCEKSAQLALSALAVTHQREANNTSSAPNACSISDVQYVQGKAQLVTGHSQVETPSNMSSRQDCAAEGQQEEEQQQQQPAASPNTKRQRCDDPSTGGSCGCWRRQKKLEWSKWQCDHPDHPAAYTEWIEFTKDEEKGSLSGMTQGVFSGLQHKRCSHSVLPLGLLSPGLRLCSLLRGCSQEC